jgi:hypothetical protein
VYLGNARREVTKRTVIGLNMNNSVVFVYKSKQQLRLNEKMFA